ncbi:MAG: DUF222 domain-containing protein, partial [Mobilicoccus sp.]|nr:DUF222 domain-containing protein [Mobilicoccus sp.]
MTTAPTLAPGASAGEVAVAQLNAARELIAAAGSDPVAFSSRELADVAIAAAGVIAAAEAARAAVVMDASVRGVIGSSDHPRTNRWVEESCREAGVPVTSAMAKQLHDITATCVGFDVKVLRDAVTSGRLSVEAAATVAGIYRRLRTKTSGANWDELAETLIAWMATGPSKKDQARLEDQIVGQYGHGDEPLDEEHASAYTRRGVGHFRTTRDGMRTATVKLDPASEEVFSSALHALSKPQTDEHGIPDARTDAQRRADGLTTMATLATTQQAGAPGSGTKARVTVTISYGDLLRDV